MKRKIALLLALAMTASMLPVNAFASSSNQINKSVSVKDDDLVEGVYLKIVPKEEIASGDTIVLNFTTSEVEPSNTFDETKTYNKSTGDAMYTYGVLQGQGKTYQSLMNQYASAAAGGRNSKSVLDGLWNDTDDVYIPWRISRTGKTEMEVELFPIPGVYCDSSWSGSGAGNGVKPYYYIPLAVTADGEGDMTVVIDANETPVSGGSTITFAQSTSDSGATTTTVDDVKDFNESLKFNDDNGNSIRIKETVSGTFEPGTLTVRINGGFEFVNKVDDITVTSGTNNPVFTYKVQEVTDSKITIKFDKFEETKKASSIIIEGIEVEPEDEDDDWGEVKFTFKGIGMTGETITVANRADYGMSLSLEEDPTSILTGFSYIVDTDLDEDDFETAEVHIEETIADTWNEKEKMYFRLPEKVKIVDFDVNDTKYINESAFDDAYLTDDGSTLVVPKLNNLDDKGGLNVDECSEFDISFYVTIDPEFGDNDITLSVDGAGIEQGLLADKVIATAVTPISIATESTKTNIGYSSIKTADITITENVAGALQDDEDIVLSIDTLWTAGDIGFDDADIEAEANGGELGIKDIKTNSGEVKIPVDKQSYSTPGSITITGVAIGTSRSVPYGDYDLEVAGPAVLNNYDDDYDDDYKTTTTPKSITLDDSNDDYRFVWTQDNTDSYAYKAYLSVATATGTLDTVVSVTIGENTIYVDGEAYTMDVAPYIQASSNSTMVPLRFVTLALGVDTNAVAEGNTDETSTIAWDQNTKTATIFYASGSGQKIIQFTAGSNQMVVDGTAVPMSYGVIAEITDSRMFVPFRALGTALGVNVTWDETTRTATYNG